MKVPRQFVEAALKAHDDGFRLIAHWLNSQPAIMRAKVKIEPCSPRPGVAMADCRNVLSNVLLGIRPYAPSIPKDDRDIAPWTLGCLARNKDQHSFVRLYFSEGDETVEQRIERLVGVYDAYGWTAEDWGVCVKTAVEEYSDQWRSTLSALAESASEAGPTGFDGFSWNGKATRGLTTKSFRLIKALWDAKSHTITRDAAEEAVYGHDELTPEYGLTSVRSQANAFFRPNVPLKVTFSGDNVALVEHQWESRAKKPAKRS
jgi:hypothetical protein